MAAVQGRIGQSTVNVLLGDMTERAAEAYIVPEFTYGASYYGVGGALKRAGAKTGLDAYQEYVQGNGEQPFGQVVLTPSYGGNSQHLLHVVSVGSGKEEEFSTIQTCFFNALKVAEANGIKSIVAPALGTGRIGDLEDDQSARAMMSAIYQHEQSGGQPIDVSFVLFGGETTLDAFRGVLNTQAYTNVESEMGKREFSLVRWQFEMSADAAADAAAAAKRAKEMSLGQSVKPMKPVVFKKKAPGI